MSGTNMIIQMAKENNVFVTAAMVTKFGISRGNLKYLVDNGNLKKAVAVYMCFRTYRMMNCLLCKIDLSEVFIPEKQHCFYGI